ncbi:DUF333 domain-containing protein [Tropicimonas sp. TH_r6]|uniref:DUF333 domain-containing protein n=1 Tax=Tropicimonas sp. TH_r6 TaxID=3082085 RepID=UPI0029532D9C|nr:DUF333 domain-containing protein [Tropicimonas sp. TH_r6]MDV7145473.1 DUF333 domain-containing protein [Tropicimonas sp. TH_r6]
MKTLLKFGLSLALLAPAAAIAEGMANMANPAAVFCKEQGGKYLIVSDDKGERGLCELPDGTTVDGWDYFRENWDKASSGN